MRNSVRLLVIGDAVHPTGYARVIHSLLPHLAESISVYHFGVNYQGQPTQPVGWPLFPNPNGVDLYGVQALPDILQQVRPTVVLIVNDLYVYSVYKPYLRAECPWAKVFLYSPVHGTQLRTEYLHQLDGLDHLVLFTESARQEILAALRQTPLAVDAAPTLDVIGHGLDTQRFYPLAPFTPESGFSKARRLARQQLFPHRPEIHSGFIFLSANRNQLRKRLDITLEAFAQFVRDKPNAVYLYLHTGLLDKGVDLLSLIEQYNLQPRILLSEFEQRHPEASDVRLNYIYNACEVGLHTSTGEGWGLTAFEHAAAGGAQILPRHSACADLWAGIGALVEPTQAFVPPFELATHHRVEASAVANQMQQHYQDATYLHQQSYQSYQYVTQPRFHWPTLAQQWLSLMERSLD